MANKLEEMATPGALTGLNRRYLSAEGMQALIDRIALLKNGLADADAKLREDLEKLIKELKDALDANTAADSARETRLETVETKVTDLENNKADKTDIKDWVLTSTYETFLADEFTPLKNKVAELINILADVVTGAQVDEAATAAGLPEAPATPEP